MKEIQGGGGLWPTRSQPKKLDAWLAVKRNRNDTSWKKRNSRDVGRTKKDVALCQCD